MTMKRSETNAYLFPRLNRRLTTEEINKHTREQIELEEQYREKYINSLNRRNKKVRTRGKQK